MSSSHIDGLFTINEIVRATNTSRPTIETIFRKNGIVPRRIIPHGQYDVRYYEESVLAVIGKHQIGEIIEEPKESERPSVPNQIQSSDPNIDRETGLTWHQLKAREEARKLRRKNDLEEQIQLKEYIKKDLHLKVVRALISRIEQIPMKAKSELGLNDQQTFSLRRMLDECRTDATSSLTQENE